MIIFLNSRWGSIPVPRKSNPRGPSHFVRIDKEVNVKSQRRDKCRFHREQHLGTSASLFDRLKHSVSTKNLFYPSMS